MYMFDMYMYAGGLCIYRFWDIPTHLSIYIYLTIHSPEPTLTHPALPLYSPYLCLPSILSLLCTILAIRVGGAMRSRLRASSTR